MKLYRISIIVITILCQSSCGTKRDATESVVETSDSSSVWSMNEQLQSEHYSANRSSDDVDLNINSLKGMDINLSNDKLTHEIIYSDNKIDTITGRPQISREIYSISSSLLKKRMGEYEILSEEQRKATEQIALENSKLSLAAEKKVTENRFQASKSANSKRFNLFHLIISFAFGCLISVFINKL